MPTPPSSPVPTSGAGLLGIPAKATKPKVTTMVESKEERLKEQIKSLTEGLDEASFDETWASPKTPVKEASAAATATTATTATTAAPATTPTTELSQPAAPVSPAPKPTPACPAEEEEPEEEPEEPEEPEPEEESPRGSNKEAVLAARLKKEIKKRGNLDGEGVAKEAPQDTFDAYDDSWHDPLPAVDQRALLSSASVLTEKVKNGSLEKIAKDLQYEDVVVKRSPGSPLAPRKLTAKEKTRLAIKDIKQARARANDQPVFKKPGKRFQLVDDSAEVDGACDVEKQDSAEKEELRAIEAEEAKHSSSFIVDGETESDEESVSSDRDDASEAEEEEEEDLEEEQEEEEGTSRKRKIKPTKGKRASAGPDDEMMDLDTVPSKSKAKPSSKKQKKAKNEDEDPERTERFLDQGGIKFLKHLEDCSVIKLGGKERVVVIKNGVPVHRDLRPTAAGKKGVPLTADNIFMGLRLDKKDGLHLDDTGYPDFKFFFQVVDELDRKHYLTCDKSHYLQAFGDKYFFPGALCVCFFYLFPFS
jgi:hypothetical protein